MKFLDYLFWSVYKFCKGKRRTESAFPYFNAILYLGVLITLIVINIFDIVPDAVRAEFQKKSIYAYLFWFICAMIFPLPFRFIFPKKKIEKLSFNEEELKRYKIIFRCIMLSLLSLYVIRAWYCW